jgi:hypothetical protein
MTLISWYKCLHKSRGEIVPFVQPYPLESDYCPDSLHFPKMVHSPSLQPLCAKQHLQEVATGGVKVPYVRQDVWSWSKMSEQELLTNFNLAPSWVSIITTLQYIVYCTLLWQGVRRSEGAKGPRISQELEGSTHKVLNLLVFNSLALLPDINRIKGEYNLLY